MSAEVRVQVPASGEFLQVLRNVVAALAARAGCSVDVLADLRLAVDEAALRLLHDVPAADGVVVEAGRDAASLALSVAVTAADDGWPRAELTSSMGWHILTSLVDDAEPTTTADGPAISFRVPTGG
ncbi:MAG TPA: ATP-binding protein [Actinomycetota bacterium]|nr:ATP-binding protein [Actinomycetota bacterium]